jgi:oxalate decarboxylase family bicupin protein
VITQNFRLAPEIFDRIPQKEKYIFQGSVPSAIELEQPSRRGVRPSRYQFTHKMLDQKPLEATGGHVRITDSTNFPISKTVAAAHLTINPGCLRELHWHPNADEWSFFIKGQARVTVFAASGVSRTFNYVAGDVGIVPRSMAHYVENLSDEEPVEMLEIFRSSKFEDFSLEQWLASTPDRMVKEHLFAGEDENGQKFLKALKGAKDPIKFYPKESKL